MFSVGHGQTTNFLLFSLDLNAILQKTASLYQFEKAGIIAMKFERKEMLRTGKGIYLPPILGFNPRSGAMSELNLFGSRSLLERFFFSII